MAQKSPRVEAFDNVLRFIYRLQHDPDLTEGQRPELVEYNIETASRLYPASYEWRTEGEARFYLAIAAQRDEILSLLSDADDVY